MRTPVAQGHMSSLDRLRAAGDIRAVFAARTVAHGSVMAVHARRRSDGGPLRATVVAGRQVGSAVERNRAKRRLRAALAQVEAPSGLDVVVQARSRALHEGFDVLQAQLQQLLQRVDARTRSGEAPRPEATTGAVSGGEGKA